MVTPFASGLYQGLKGDDETPETPQDVEQVIAQQQKKLQPGEQQASAKTSKKSDDTGDDKDDSEMGLDFGQLFNTRMVSHAPIASFRSLPMQYNSFQQSLDNTTDILMESITGKAGESIAALVRKVLGKKSRKKKDQKDDDNKDQKDQKDQKEPGKMSKGAGLALGLGGAGLGSRALLASGILGPALLAGGLGGLFGSSSDPTGGQPLTPDLGSGSGSGPGAQSAMGSVFDRLTSAYGYIPGFNPAGIALQTLGKRVGV